ncbi:ROK family protein, partial [Streptomyces tendae]
MRHVIALDVGGTGMKAALAGPGGELLHQARRATGRERGPEAVPVSVLKSAFVTPDHLAQALREGECQ